MQTLGEHPSRLRLRRLFQPGLAPWAACTFGLARRRTFACARWAPALFLPSPFTFLRLPSIHPSIFPFLRPCVPLHLSESLALSALRQVSVFDSVFFTNLPLYPFRPVPLSQNQSKNFMINCLLPPVLPCHRFTTPRYCMGYSLHP